MLAIWDWDQGFIVQSTGSRSPLSSIAAMRCGGFPIELKHWQNEDFRLVSELYNPALVTSLFAEVKKLKEFDGPSLIPEVTFTEDVENKIYKAELNFVNDALDELFKVNNNAADDVSPLGLQLGFGLTPTGKAMVPSNNIPLNLTNNAARGDSGFSAATPTFLDDIARNSIRQLWDVVGRTGGGGTKLDGFQAT